MVQLTRLDRGTSRCSYQTAFQVLRKTVFALMRCLPLIELNLADITHIIIQRLVIHSDRKYKDKCGGEGVILLSSNMQTVANVSFNPLAPEFSLRF